MASSITKSLVTKTNASKFGRFLAGTPSTPPSLEGLFRMADFPNPFDEKLGMLASANPHHHERKQDLGNCVTEFLSNQDISLEDLATLLDILDDVVFSSSIEVIPPHIKERMMLRMAKVRSTDQSADSSSAKVFEDKVEVYVEAPCFLKERSPISGTKVLNKHIMFDASFPYDSSKVSAVLENGVLKVKFPVGTMETMQAEPFKWE